MQPDVPGRLILLPELGLNSKIFEPQVRFFGGAVVQPNWIEPREGESIHDYNVRWVRTFQPLPGDDTPLVLGGLSFGSLFALEMAGLLKPRAVVLIAGCRTPADLPRRVRLFDRLLQCLPSHVAERFVTLVTNAFILREQLDDVNAAMVRRVARDYSLPLLRWGLHQVVQSERCDLVDAGAMPPVYRIHGRRDWMLPMRGRGDVDHVIPDGRHLINLTHPRSVNRFILGLMDKHCRGES